MLKKLKIVSMFILFLLLTPRYTAFDYEQYINGRKHWEAVTKGKYRSLMKFHNGAVKGMHVPRTVVEVDNPYMVRNKAFFFSKYKTVDPRHNPAFYQWKIRRRLKGYAGEFRYGPKRRPYVTYNDKGHEIMTRTPIYFDENGDFLEHK